MNNAAEELTEQAQDTAEEIAEEATDTAEAKKAEKKKQERTPEEEKERALNKVKRRKKWKYGALATVMTIVFVAIVVMINVIVGMLDDRFTGTLT